MRKLAWLAGATTLLASGSYVFVYLYRWEWTRALFVTMVFVAAEIAMATALVLRRLASAPAATQPDGLDPAVLARLRESAPEPPDRFAWLEGSLRRTNVFVTILLGGGIVVSGAAWVVDRIARRTAGPAVERRLARDLGALAFPADGLLPHEADVLTPTPGPASDELRLLLGPQARRR